MRLATIAFVLFVTGMIIGGLYVQSQEPEYYLDNVNKMCVKK